jgi:hypothetical protein
VLYAILLMIGICIRIIIVVLLLVVMDERDAEVVVVRVRKRSVPNHLFGKGKQFLPTGQKGWDVFAELGCSFIDANFVHREGFGELPGFRCGDVTQSWVRSTVDCGSFSDFFCPSGVRGRQSQDKL